MDDRRERKRGRESVGPWLTGPPPEPVMMLVSSSWSFVVGRPVVVPHLPRLLVCVCVCVRRACLYLYVHRRVCERR